MLHTDNKTTINTRHFKYCICRSTNSHNRSHFTFQQHRRVKQQHRPGCKDSTLQVTRHELYVYTLTKFPSGEKCRP